MAYIYKIINDANQKVYIGKTEYSIERRFCQHCSDAFKRTEEQRPLYAAMRKYGIDHFHVELIEETDNPNEREIYWIEQYRSFKYGYNATLGGEGRRYLDYDLIISTYQEIGVVKDVAKLLNIDPSTVSQVLHSHHIDIASPQQIAAMRKSKITNMYDLQGNFIRSFPSTNEAARYMVDNNLTNCKITTIKQHITEVCTGRRKTAAKYKWKYGD